MARDCTRRCSRSGSSTMPTGWAIWSGASSRDWGCSGHGPQHDHQQPGDHLCGAVAGGAGARLLASLHHRLVPAQRDGAERSRPNHHPRRCDPRAVSGLQGDGHDAARCWIPPATPTACPNPTSTTRTTISTRPIFRRASRTFIGAAQRAAGGPRFHQSRPRPPQPQHRQTDLVDSLPRAALFRERVRRLQMESRTRAVKSAAENQLDRKTSWGYGSDPVSVEDFHQRFEAVCDVLLRQSAHVRLLLHAADRHLSRRERHLRLSAASPSSTSRACAPCSKRPPPSSKPDSRPPGPLSLLPKGPSCACCTQAINQGYSGQARSPQGSGHKQCGRADNKYENISAGFTY